jgi:hypothetical protein
LRGQRAIKTIVTDEACALLGVRWPVLIQGHRLPGYQMREDKDGYSHTAKTDKFEAPISPRTYVHGCCSTKVLKEGKDRETLCAVYKLSTMVCTSLYDLGGDLPA